MRRSELSGLRWSDIHSDRIVLSAAVTKTATAHHIPLTDLMREILASQPRTTSPLVFPSDQTGRAMCGWGPLMEKLVEKANIGPWKIHDTRRTCRTLMSRYGVPEPAAELAIGHVKATLVGLYNLDEQWRARVDAFTRVSDHVTNLLGANAMLGAA
jgi:integrase